ncbi:MAG: hypothetical protein ABSB81_10760 [Halobacteriota archaeon]
MKYQLLNSGVALVTTHMPRLNESLSKFIDVEEETDEDIIRCFRKKSKPNDVFLSIIAPYYGVRVTPSKVKSAELGVSEEFSIETAIEEIKKLLRKDTEDALESHKLYLLVHSPGGLVASSYKVARALKKSFAEIIAFVPHTAASGGTLVALTGNEIVMGMMSEISPLDPTIGDTSAQSIVEGFEYVEDKFKKISEADATYSLKALADKYDAIQLQVAYSLLFLMTEYIQDIMKGTYTDQEIRRISTKLVSGYLHHSQVLHADEAKNLGLKVVTDNKYPELWQAFRDLLGEYLLQGGDKHIIRYWVNDGESDAKGGAKSAKTNTKT